MLFDDATFSEGRRNGTKGKWLPVTWDQSCLNGMLVLDYDGDWPKDTLLTEDGGATFSSRRTSRCFGVETVHVYTLKMCKNGDSSIPEWLNPGLCDRQISDAAPQIVVELEEEWKELNVQRKKNPAKNKQLANVLQLCEIDDDEQLLTYLEEDALQTIGSPKGRRYSFLANQCRWRAVGSDSKSMLMIVAGTGAARCAAVLLEFGAEVEFLNEEGETASSLARAHGFAALADALDEGLDAVRLLSPRLPRTLDDTLTLSVGDSGSRVLLRVFKNKLLGSGNASVYCGELSDRPGEQLAVKIIPHGKTASTSTGLEGQSKEAMLQSRLGSHPNVVKYFFHEEHLGDTFLAMEKCDCCLVEAVTGRRLTDQELISTGRQICGAIQYLHEECNIAHRDLKPANILLLGATVKVCDFGGAKDLGLDRSKTLSGADQGGSEHWQPPERREAASRLQALQEELVGLSSLKELVTRATSDGVSKEAFEKLVYEFDGNPSDRAKKLIIDNAVKQYYLRVDAFSLGCVLFFVLTRGKHPFGDDHLDVLNNIASSSSNLEALASMPRAQQLVGMLLVKEAPKRPTAADSALHELFSMPARHGEENRETEVQTAIEPQTSSQRCPIGSTGYHIFLSSRRQDVELASQVHAKLERRGYKVFLAGSDDGPDSSGTVAAESGMLHLKATPVLVALFTGTIGSQGRPEFLQIQQPGDRVRLELRSALHMEKLLIPLCSELFDSEELLFGKDSSTLLPPDITGPAGMHLAPGGVFRTENLLLSRSHFDYSLEKVHDRIEDVAVTVDRQSGRPWLEARTDFKGQLPAEPVWTPQPVNQLKSELKPEQPTAREADLWRTAGTAWGAPPQEQKVKELILSESLRQALPRYHFFLGHRQVGGGAQVGELDALLKYRLGMQCWRDVNQQIQDVDAMIRGVAESSVYLLYLTSDALSYFVTIEARAAMTLSKPCFVLMENDRRKPSYAGGKVEVATASWPADLREYFDSGRYVGWGGEPFEWSDADIDAKLKTILKRCAEVAPPVPASLVAGVEAVSWAAALQRIDAAAGPPLGPGLEPEPEQSTQPHGGAGRLTAAPSFLTDLLAGQGLSEWPPPLPAGCDYHLFLSKHEGLAKADAEVIGRVLRDELGLSVWLSQFEGALGRPVDEAGMQAGVRSSAMVLLILTPGIFRRERRWVTHTEVKYAIDLGKPVQLLGKGFDLDTKLAGAGRCGHLKECCEGVAEDFQPYARALPRALEVSGWASDADVRKAMLVKIARKYLQREAAAGKLAAVLAEELAAGPCGGTS